MTITSTIISSILDGVAFGKKTHHGSLTMFPLRSEGAGGLEYLTLTEALEAGFARVSEVSEGGSVPELRLANTGSLPVLIIDGEELVGAKQNRVANLTIMAPARATITIPVSCVEAGRWRYSREDFTASKTVHFAMGRAVRTKSVSESLCCEQSRRSDQGRVWRDISAKAERMHAASSTSAMAAIFEKHAARVEDYVAAFGVNGDSAGAVFAIGEAVVGLDLFDEPSTFRLMMPKLVRSYAVDAIENTEPKGRGCTRKAAKAFLSGLAAADVRSYPAVGLGTDIRLTGPGVIGGALAVDEHLVHMAAFATPEDEVGGTPDGPRPSMARTRLRRRFFEHN